MTAERKELAHSRRPASKIDQGAATGGVVKGPPVSVIDVTGFGRTTGTIPFSISNAHEIFVAKAVAEGKDVPESVLREYPDLVSPAAPSPAAGVPTQPKIYHGTRTTDVTSFVNSDGDLVLRPSENFGGRQVGVSFSQDLKTAEDYASRVPGEGSIRSKAQGMVFEIDSDCLQVSCGRA